MAFVPVGREASQMVWKETGEAGGRLGVREAGLWLDACQISSQINWKNLDNRRKYYPYSYCLVILKVMICNHVIEITGCFASR